MAIPISEGRMIRKDISKSQGFSKLRPESQLLFCLLIPHFNAHGKMNGNIYFIKGEIVPLLDQYGTRTIELCLRDISMHTSVKWFTFNGLQYLHSIHWKKHQQLRDDKLGIDKLPDYDGTTPELGYYKVEVEVKEEVEVKGEGKEKPLSVSQAKADAIPYQKICDTMNQILGTGFKNADSFKKLVKARVHEGMTIDDFAEVCRKKFAEWGSDLKMMQYLRPDTLFNSKMNSYLGAPSAGRPVGERERVNFAAGQEFLSSREGNVWTTET